MNIDDVMQVMLGTYPNALLDIDKNGELVVFTGLAVVDSDETVMEMGDK